MFTLRGRLAARDSRMLPVLWLLATLVLGGLVGTAAAAPEAMTPAPPPGQRQRSAGDRDTPPPIGPGIRQCAEWEPITGALIAYSFNFGGFGLPFPLLQEIAEDTDLWVLVSAQDRPSCEAQLRDHGVDMDRVRFALTLINSWYTRDYGPQFVFDADGDQGIIDHHYYTVRPNDDASNYALGMQWEIPVYGSPLKLSGGNLMCDGHGSGHSTDLVYQDNPGYSPTQIAGVMHDYLGIENYRVIQDVDPEPLSIHHIDCWAKLLDEETLLIAQVYPTNSLYPRLEQNVLTMRTWTNAYGRPYRIVRVYCGGEPHQSPVAFTNSIILNRKVLVPIQPMLPELSEAALQVYRDAMPGYEVIGFDGIWGATDAIHCRVMGIHDQYMLRVDVAPLFETQYSTGDIRLDVEIDDRSEAGLESDSLLVCWRVAGTTDFAPQPLFASAGVDSFHAEIPGQPMGTSVEYYILARDLSGRRETRPPTAPAGYYSYFVGDPASVPGDAAPALASMSNWPNPFTNRTTIRYRLPVGGPVTLEVLDVQGRRVATLADGQQSGGGHGISWNGRGDSGRGLPGGFYLFRLSAGGQTAIGRGVLVRR